MGLERKRHAAIAVLMRLHDNPQHASLDRRAALNHVQTSRYRAARAAAFYLAVARFHAPSLCRYSVAHLGSAHDTNPLSAAACINRCTKRNSSGERADAQSVC